MNSTATLLLWGAAAFSKTASAEAASSLFFGIFAAFCCKALHNAPSASNFPMTKARGGESKIRTPASEASSEALPASSDTSPESLQLSSWAAFPLHASSSKNSRSRSARSRGFRKKSWVSRYSGIRHSAVEHFRFPQCLPTSLCSQPCRARRLTDGGIV